MSRAKLWFSLSGAILVLAAAGLVLEGMRFGLEFTGGRLIEYFTEEPADLEAVRSELADAGFPRAVVQESGDGNVAIRTSQITEDDEDAVQGAVEEVTGPAEEVRDEFIGPSIGDELRRKAFIALGIGLTVQLLFLAIRFRWTYGASAVVALFHDVTILLGIFAWLGKEIDGVFIAALLTVIGYSINDSVVVFDRIREHRTRRTKESLATVANEAVLATVPRTINTGLGALFILVALYFLGGETLTDFAFALIVGILIGTYSSVFTAAPLAIAFEKLSGAEAPSQRPAPARQAAARRRIEPAPATRTGETVEGDETVEAGEKQVAPARPAARPGAGSSKKKRRRRRR